MCMLKNYFTWLSYYLLTLLRNQPVLEIISNKSPLLKRIERIIDSSLFLHLTVKVREVFYTSSLFLCFVLFSGFYRFQDQTSGKDKYRYSQHTFHTFHRERGAPSSQGGIVNNSKELIYVKEKSRAVLANNDLQMNDDFESDYVQINSTAALALDDKSSPETSAQSQEIEREQVVIPVSGCNRSQ